jgi:hypothetical protein
MGLNGLVQFVSMCCPNEGHSDGNAPYPEENGRCRIKPAAGLSLPLGPFEVATHLNGDLALGQALENF